jgi:hypothetical protein
MIDEAELRRMSPEERRQLAHALAVIDAPHMLQDPRMERRRRVGLLVMMGACVFLAAWIGILAVNLPRHYTAGHWKLAWIGLDLAELVAFAATAWASWHERQVLVVCMLITGTLLWCDAWFDVVLSAGGSDFWSSVAAAAFLELPLGFLMFAGARRVLKMTFVVVMRLEGVTGSVPPLRRIPLFGEGLEGALPETLRAKQEAPAP